MNPTALLTGSLSKPAAGGSLQGGSLGQPDVMAFSKHLNAKDTAIDIAGSAPRGIPSNTANGGFASLLNSVAVLIDGDYIGAEVEVVEAADGSDHILQENMQNVVPGGSDAPLESVGTIIPVIGKVQAVIRNDVIENNGVISANGVANVGQDVASIVETKPVNNEKMQQFSIPEIRRVPASEGSARTSDQIAVKSEDGGNTLKTLVQSQGAGTFGKPSSEGERQPILKRSSETPVPSFQGSVTSAMKEVVTERQVSSVTSIQERAVVEQLANGTARVVSKGAGKVVIKLTPEHLGNVEVTLGKKNGLTTVRVVVERSETMDMIRADIRNLERSLIEAGVDVKSNSINIALKSSSRDAEPEEGRNEEGFSGGKRENSEENKVGRLTRGYDINHDGLLNIRV